MNEQSIQKVVSSYKHLINVYVDPFNKRVRLDDYLGNIKEVILELTHIAKEIDAEKIIIKGRQEHFSELFQHGFQMEAMLDGYFHGSNMYFFSKFLTEDRKVNEHWLQEDIIIQNIYELELKQDQTHPPKQYICKKAGPDDAAKLASLYKTVFAIYPTPLHDEEYIKKTMKEGTIYFCYLYEGEIVSSASAEVNKMYRNAELTDCATLIPHRKHGLMKILLQNLEDELKKENIFTAYSIARSLSFGMNAVLYQLGYNYRGRLMNNCYIYDKLENMNVWVKNLG